MLPSVRLRHKLCLLLGMLEDMFVHVGGSVVLCVYNMLRVVVLVGEGGDCCGVFMLAWFGHACPPTGTHQRESVQNPSD